MRLLSYELKRGFPIYLLNDQAGRGTDRAVANDLAEWAEGGELRASVQVTSALVLNLAEPCSFAMLVKDFGRKKVDFTCEQHAHDQGARPVVVPIFSPASHLNDLALSGLVFKLLALPCQLSIIPDNLPTEECRICPLRLI